MNHTLVYRDPAVELGKVKKMVQEYRRVSDMSEKGELQVRAG